MEITSELKEEIRRRREANPTLHSFSSDEEMAGEILKEWEEKERKRRKELDEKERERHAEENFRNTLSSLETLFDQQIEKFLALGYPDAMGISEGRFLSYVLPLKELLPPLARKMTQQQEELSAGRIPFLIIVPFGVRRKLPLLMRKGQRGFSELTGSLVSIPTPKGNMYLIVDVEDGRSMLDTSPSRAQKEFKIENRSPLTADEGLSLVALYPEILDDHYIHLPGSKIERSYEENSLERPARVEYSVTHVWLSGGRPKLDDCPPDHTSKRWGSASCATRIDINALMTKEDDGKKKKQYSNQTLNSKTITKDRDWWEGIDV